MWPPAYMWAAYTLYMGHSQGWSILVRCCSHSSAKRGRNILSYSVLTLEATSHNLLQLCPTALKMSII